MQLDDKIVFWNRSICKQMKKIFYIMYQGLQIFVKLWKLIPKKAPLKMKEETQVLKLTKILLIQAII